MSSNRKLKIAAAVGLSFTALIVAVLVLLAKHVISYQMALLIFVAMLGLYLGFGVLIAVYRFVGRLD